jgi:C_GCAxxG_C_C family probable redox protein
MSHYGDQAEAFFRQGYSCAQSVAAPFAGELGLREGQVLRMMSGFGAGFGRMRQVCGAFSGATFVLSTLYGAEEPAGKSATYALIQQLGRDFSARSGGSIVCRELLGLAAPEGTPVASPRTAEYYQKRPCPALVRMAAELCADYLNSHPHPGAAEGDRPS